jgi:hypothetical protein
MPTVIATPGAPDANSFITVARGDTIADERLYATNWSAETDEDQKARAVIMATSEIAKECWKGIGASSTQSLPFPRTGLLDRNGYVVSSSTIPSDIELATFILADLLLGSNVTIESDPSVQGITKIKAGSVELGFKDVIEYKSIPEHVRRLIPDSWFCDDEDNNVVVRSSRKWRGI